MCADNYHFDSSCKCCVLDRNLAENAATYQSSTYDWYFDGQSVNFTSNLAVDFDDSTDFRDASCSLTNTNTSESVYWLVDLGQEMEVASISVTLPEILYDALIFIGQDPGSYYMFTESGDIPSSFTPTAEVSAIGLACWKLYTSDDLYHDVICGDGPTWKNYSGYALVNVIASTDRVKKLTLYHILDGDLCLGTSGTSPVITKTPSNGCDVFFVDENELYSLDERPAGFNEAGDFVFGQEGALFLNFLDGTIDGFNQGYCVVANLLEYRQTTGSCKIFTFIEMNQYTLPERLRPEVGVGSLHVGGGDAFYYNPFANALQFMESFNGTFNNAPCVEPWEPTETLYISYATRNDALLTIPVDSLADDPLLFLFSEHDAMLHDFYVLVGNHFSSPGEPVFAYFDECNYHHGNLKDGETHTISCPTVPTGRYVAIYMPSDQMFFNGDIHTEIISLCDVKVSGIPVDAVACTTDGDCQYYDHYMICMDGMCTCMPGFKRQIGLPDLKYPSGTCADIDECVLDLDLCGSFTYCENNVGNYSCPCSMKHYVHDDAYSCEYESPCTPGLDPCEHDCEDDDPGYHCECRPGYTLSDNLHTCDDVNECNDSVNCFNGSCLNVPGSWHCDCDTGHTWRFDTEHEASGCFPNLEVCESAGCDHTCIDTNPGYQCLCDHGYHLDDDEHTCLDNNECSPESCVNGVCVNINGSSGCDCFPGYSWQFNAAEKAYGCWDTDECHSSYPCEQLCINEAASYMCDCVDGYRLTADKGLPGYGVCEPDITTPPPGCEHQNGGCEQICLFAVHAYSCSCEEGFELSENEHSCLDLDECEENPCGVDALCHNMYGSYECRCNHGYHYNDNITGCIDINECVTHNGDCHHWCNNSIGSWFCYCDDGYTLTGDELSCRDIDECLEEDLLCNHDCINTPGGFMCNCYEDFHLENGTCVPDIEQCSPETDCSQYCNNSTTGYYCSCDPGYEIGYDEHTCIDVDECKQHQCDGSCMNTAGSYVCFCSAGLELQMDGHRCFDVDECEENNGRCEGDCDNTYGSYYCSCSLGYTLAENQHSCQDYDECHLGISDCEQECINTPGSYRCQCAHYYVLSLDMHSCKAGITLDNLCGGEDGFPRYCHGDAECVEKDDHVFCECPAGFSGLRCEVKEEEGLSGIELVLLALFCAMAVILLCISCCMLLTCRQNKQPPPVACATTPNSVMPENWICHGTYNSPEVPVSQPWYYPSYWTSKHNRTRNHRHCDIK